MGKARSTADYFASVLAMVLVGGILFAGSEPQAETRMLVVATREAPPFVIKQEDGSLSGIAIELWRGVARRLGVTYEFKETDLAGMLEGLQDGSLDAAVAALTVTPQREALVDFSHPFHTSGLAIAVPADTTGDSSSSRDYLDEHFISATDFPDIRQALDAVAAGKLAAAVYDAPVLRYLATSQFAGKIEVLPGVFRRQDYAFALRPGSPMREDLNRALLHRIYRPEWERTLFRYLGN